MMKQNTLIQKQLAISCKSQLRLFVTGIKQVKSILLELHPTFECTISRIYKTFLAAILLLRSRKKLSIVELVPQNNWMTLKDKNIFSQVPILITNWLQTSALVLIGKEKVCKPFWNLQCQENSKKLWLPIETDLRDSHLNSSSSSWKEIKSNSWFSIEKKEKAKKLNSQKTLCQSSTFIPAEKWVKEDIRSRKIRIYPTAAQRNQLRQWIGTSRYVYNRCLEDIKTNNENINFYSLRNKFVIAKNNELVSEWECQTPKDVRAGAIQDLVTNYKSAFSNLKRGNIKRFSMDYKSRKRMFSLRIPKTAVKLNSSHITIYKRYLGLVKLSRDRSLSQLKIEKDIRLFIRRGKWYISVPYVKQSHTEKKKKKKKRCALDPGVISFQTSFSENEIYKFNGIDKIKKQNQRIDKTRSLLAEAKGRKKTHLIRKLLKSYDRYHNLIDELHYKTASFLTKRYEQILLPTFESQEMLGRNRKVNRWLLDLKHYQFQQRLINKCSLEKHSSVMLVNEAYTSKTCGSCGKLNQVEGRVLDCSGCRAIIDRDTNGSRNIYLKYI